MKITIKRTGGYAGLDEEVAAIDTAQLAPEKARQVAAAINQANFFTQPAYTGEVGADMLRYEISVSDAGRTHQIAFAEDGSPETAALHALVEEVSRLA